MINEGRRGMTSDQSNDKLKLKIESAPKSKKIRKCHKISKTLKPTKF